MTITQAEPRSVGRPSAKEGTIRILPTGVIRLSPDLCVADTFQVSFDIAKKQLLLAPDGPFKLWYSSPNAKSGLLSIPTVFETLGISAKKLAGEYKIQKVKSWFVVEL